MQCQMSMSMPLAIFWASLPASRGTFRSQFFHHPTIQPSSNCVYNISFNPIKSLEIFQLITISLIFAGSKNWTLHLPIMKIDLPLENWVDLFGSVPREQLVELLPQIDDRQFAKVLLFFLHKCGQITIGSLDIEKDEEGSIIARRYPHKFPLADVPMPSNIHNFRKITITRISLFDPSIISFLQKFQTNSLLDNVNLKFYHCNAEDVLAFLTKIVPMITSINSITAQGFTRTNNILGLLANKFPSLSKTMLTSARILNTWHNLSIDWICGWLYTPRNDGKPRVLDHFIAPSWKFRSDPIFNNYDNLVDRVKKDFMEATQPISFFLSFPRLETEVQPLTLENVQTHETLVISNCVDGFRDVLISRYPTGVSEEWIEEMSHNKDWENRNILIDGNDNRYEWSSCSSDVYGNYSSSESEDEIPHYPPEIKPSRTRKATKKAMKKQGRKSRKKRKQSRMKKMK